MRKASSPNPLTDRGLRRIHPWLPFLGAALLAIIVRIVYLQEVGGSPLLSVLLGDSRQYDAWARQIAGGQWVGTEIFYQTPLYPYLLAIIFSVAGHSLAWVRLIQACLGAASCLLLGLAGRRFFGNRAGIIAALGLAVYPPAIFFDGLIQKSSLDIFLVTLSLALLGEFYHRRDWKWLAALGAATAALVLNRENALVLYPVIAAWLLFCFRDVPVRRRMAWTSVFLAASLAVLLPVGLRNFAVGGEFVLTTSQMGPNFFIGNNPLARGSYAPLVPERGDAAFERQDAERLASEAAGRKLSPREVSDYWLRKSISYIRSQPAHWLALLGKKAWLTLHADEIPDTESIEAYSDYSRILRVLGWLHFGVILPFAVLGAWHCRRDWRRLLILYGMLTAMVLSVALFYVVARYRHPLVPLVLMFAGAGISGLLEEIRPCILADKGGRNGRDKTGDPAAPSPPDWRRQWLPGLLAAGLIAVAANYPIRVVQDETYTNVGSLMVKQGRFAEAVPLLAKAVSANPAIAAPHLALGVAHRNLNQPDEALRHLREAARLAPESMEARSNLGLALMDVGRPKDAVDELKRAVELDPENPHARNYLAGALQQTGEIQSALPEYRKALALKPDYAEAHNNLALALASVQDYEGAFHHFREAIRLLPRHYQFRANFGRVLADAGKTAEGLEQLEEAARLAPDAIDVPYLASRILARAGRFAAAVASLERALDLANARGESEAARQIVEAIGQTRALMDRRHP